MKIPHSRHQTATADSTHSRLWEGCSRLLPIGDPLSRRDLYLPEIDYTALLEEQEKEAVNLRHRPRPPATLKERLLEKLEGPWSPPWFDLPWKRTPEMSGNAREPFRRPAESPTDAACRAARLAELRACERRWKLTSWTTVFEYAVPIPVLPARLDGLKILHLSDIHFVSGNERALREMDEVAAWVERGGSGIDVILLSGDIITKGPDDLCRHSLRSLRRLSDVCPRSFMVYGNHDYHGHTPAFISRELERVGFYDINNRAVRLTFEGSPLNIIGVDDAYFGRPRAPDTLTPGETNIVLTHNLDAVRRNFPAEVDLVLSGHTHWGEIRFLNGSRIMRTWGYCDNVNNHTRHWDILSDRTASYVHPGLARYYVRGRLFRQPPGVAVHTLRAVKDAVTADQAVCLSAPYV